MVMQYDLVFEGGGAKGFAFIGALQELERRGQTMGRLLGTSAGAILATLAAAGFNASELNTMLDQQQSDGTSIFQQLLGKPRPFTPEEVNASAIRRLLLSVDFPQIPNIIENRLDNLILSMMTREQFSHIFSFIERGGWYSADKFLDWSRRMLNTGTFNGQPRQMGNLNLAEFFRTTKKELSIIAADTTAQRLLVLNHYTAPDLPVIWAMRMSMSLPLLWQEVVWQREWGNYLGRSLTGHQVVDGGLLSNFPIELFLSNDPHVINVMGPKTGAPLLGLLIDEQLPVPNSSGLSNSNNPNQIDISLLPITSRIKNLIDTATQARDKMVIAAFEQYVCRLPAQGYGTTEFKMEATRRKALIDAGRAAVDAYFREQEIQAMIAPDIGVMETALNQANQIAANLLRP